jgi:hypothetical protein
MSSNTFVSGGRVGSLERDARMDVSLGLLGELIKHRDILKNLLGKNEGGIFQKVAAFTAPGNRYAPDTC